MNLHRFHDTRPEGAQRKQHEMENTLHKRTVTIEVPAVDPFVLQHHEDAQEAIAEMSPSRSYKADASLRTWRRALTAANLKGKDGYAFEGHFLTAGQSASLKPCALVLCSDTSWAKANWYARRYITPIRRYVQVLRVTDEGLAPVFATMNRSWARDVLGFLATNQELCEATGIRLRE